VNTETGIFAYLFYGFTLVHIC